MKRLLLMALLLLASGCSPPPKKNAVDVIGVPFVVPVAQLKNFLPGGAKPEHYPLIPFYGYKLQYPNPENWEVLVQDDGGGLLEKAIFNIYISRTLDDKCVEKDAKSMARSVERRYFDDFNDSFLNKHGKSYIFFGASDRKMLTVEIRCSAETLSASFTYLDLDRYKYQQPDEITKLIMQKTLQAKEYASRTLKGYY